MPDFEILWENGPRFYQAEHFKLGTDTVLLANFAGRCNAKKGIDLGCASGALGLLLLWNDPRLHMTGLEIVEDACRLAEKNMLENGLEERSRIVMGDIRRHRDYFPHAAFELVLANPPYFPYGSGAVSPDPQRAAARGEMLCTLEDICAAAAYLCKSGGSVCLVHKPERLSELFGCMTKQGIEPKRLRMVCHNASSAPNLVLVEGRRGGKPGLKVEPQLVLRNPDGSETEEIKSIYHRI